MRTGVICSGAVAIAAIATAILIQIDALGPAKIETAAAARAETAPTIRRVDAPPVFSPPAAQPQAIATSDSVNVASGADATPTRLVATTIETTGSIAPTQKLYVNGSRVALRSAPDGSAKIVDRMSDGQKLVEMSRNGEWVRVRFPDSNAEGWVNSSLVSPSPTRRR